MRWIADLIVLGCALAAAHLPLAWWIVSAHGRLVEAEGAVEPEMAVAVARPADEGYCSSGLRKVLRRVLKSCGLVEGGTLRGCHPAEARTLATMSGEDFNALIAPLDHRAGIIQFDAASAELTLADTALLDTIYADRQGASYFFVVARASPDGSQVKNRNLSEARGKAVLDHLHKRFNPATLDEEVALLWLGEEFAQLDDEFCTWRRSGDQDTCSPTTLNRSAFVAWVDCRI